jgi:hypothetical protein
LCSPVFTFFYKKYIIITIYLPRVSYYFLLTTYEYSINDCGARRKAGHVTADKSPVNDARDFKNE